MNNIKRNVKIAFLFFYPHTFISDINITRYINKNIIFAINN